jgi:hypothetical protein
MHMGGGGCTGGEVGCTCILCILPGYAPVRGVNLFFHIYGVKKKKKEITCFFTYFVQVEPGLGRTTTVLLSRGTLKPSAYLVGELVSLGQGHTQAFSLPGGGVGKSRTGSQAWNLSGGGVGKPRRGTFSSLHPTRLGSW